MPNFMKITFVGGAHPSIYASAHTINCADVVGIDEYKADLEIYESQSFGTKLPLEGKAFALVTLNNRAGAYLAKRGVYPGVSEEEYGKMIELGETAPLATGKTFRTLTPLEEFIKMPEAPTGKRQVKKFPEART